MDAMIAGLTLTPMKHITGDAGDIFHVIKNNATGYNGFGEVYISTIKSASIKGWKKHTKMTLNIVVPIGEIKFVLFDAIQQQIEEVTLSPQNYQRLTVSPGIWMAFKGVSEKESFLINFADIQHDPLEAENLPLTNSFIPYEW